MEQRNITSFMALVVEVEVDAEVEAGVGVKVSSNWLLKFLDWTWTRHCNKKHPPVVKFYVWLCVALRYPDDAMSHLCSSFTPSPHHPIIRLPISPSASNFIPSRLVIVGQETDKSGATKEAETHLLSQRNSPAKTMRLPLPAQPTPLGNNSRLFGKSTACFILAV